MIASRPTRHTGGVDLTGIAAAAHRALGGSALAVVVFEAGRAPSILASEGLTPGDPERIVPVLDELASRLTAVALQGSTGPAAPMPPRWLRHAPSVDRGYRGALAAATPLIAGGLAAVVALADGTTSFENEELAGVFAAQAGTALDQPARLRRHGSAADRLEDVAALERLVLAGTGLDGLTAALNDAIGSLVGATSTGVMVWDDRRQVLRLLPGSFGATDGALASCVISAEDFSSNSARVFSTGRGFFGNDVRRHPALFRDFVDVFALERVLSVPLLLAGRPIGVLHLANKPGDFTVEDLDRAEALAPRVATVVEVAQAHLRLRCQRRLEELLSEVAVALASGRSVHDFLMPAFDAMGDVADASLLALVRDDAGPIVWRRDDLSNALERRVLAEAMGHPGVRAYVVGPEAPGDPGWAAFHVPVHLGSQRVGTLVALRDRGESFAAEERHAIARLASLVALARATERYQQQRAELARLHERQRIAEDLHDDVAQLLFAAQLSLDATLERDGMDATVADSISQARGLLVRGDAAIRTVIDRLATPAPADVPLRLASAVAHIEQAFGKPVHLEVSEDAAVMGGRVHRDPGDVLVQVARQAMVRAAGRDGPHRITVRLEHQRPGALVLTVEDDGVGAGRRDTRDLTAIRRRLSELGGGLRVRHYPTGGTRVRATLPV